MSCHLQWTVAAAVSRVAWRGALAGCKRLASSIVSSHDLRRGAIFLHNGLYCEVRSIVPAGHGRASNGGYHVRFRELLTRKARELRLGETAQVTVVECERAELPVLYKDMSA